MRRGLLIGLLVVLTVACVIGGAMAQERIQRLPREETLYVMDYWGVPSTWNPLAAPPDWPVNTPERVLIYECLFAFNMLTGDLDPLLATRYEWVDDLTLRVYLDEKAHWQNGEPLTSEDVVYSFELAKRYPLDYSDFWDYTDSVTALDDATIEFKLKADNSNRLLLTHQLGFTRIVPKSIISKVEEENDYDISKIRQWNNQDPIGSGPYRLYDFSDQRIILRRYEDYWGNANWGKPAPTYIVHPIYKSNDAANRAFEQGELDVTQTFIPQVWEMFDKGNISTWYKSEPYHVPASMPSLFLNLTKKPMDDPEFRRALAHAIDYERIAQLAMTRYSEPMQPGLILPFGSEAQYFDDADVEKYGWEYNPEKAEQILQEAGYIKGPDGKYRYPDGSPIGTLIVECPYGWSDWMVSLEIVAQCAQRIGLDIRTEFPEAPVRYDRMLHGSFDMTMNTPGGQASPAQPWLRFRDAIFSRGVPDVGEMAFRNWGRYRNPEADEIIAKIPSMTDEEEILAAYKELNVMFMKDVPVIPLVYRPWKFYTYSERYWKGFPDETNPYAPPQIAIDGAGVRTLFNIEPVK
ncbi:MAG: ABC transporter substrate-binding protein [Limnochordia bacterium]